MSRVLCITGMHRSGTSLVASILQRAGLHIGDQLLGAYAGNPRGHFEDVDFYAFHERLLQRFGQTYLVQNAASLGVISQKETEEARELIRRRARSSFWGWKDPRTALFLDFWHDLLPDPCYILLYRHPVEVALSLLRRGALCDVEALANPLSALRAWQVYNERVLDFYLRHPEICLLCDIHAITVGVEAFIDTVTAKLDLPLRREGTQSLFYATELRSMALQREALSAFNCIMPQAARAYEKLEATADLTIQQPLAEDVTGLSSDLAALAQAVCQLARHNLLREDEIAHFCSLLLTLLAPDTVLGGKAALDEFRQSRIRELEEEAITKDQRIRDLGKRLSSIETSRTWHLVSRLNSLRHSMKRLGSRTLVNDDL